mmetsp:Transcript_51592/g.95480  ORF Transcript_51592/g.95480 Transcript_51592/m.95480 type:complete len:378 (+) Transcript_51592:79-1212(+)
MSFLDRGSAGKGGALPSGTAQLKKAENKGFEWTLRAKIQEMQESNRVVSDYLDKAHRGHLSKRMSEGLDQALDRSRDVAHQMEQIFQDWTLQMAGEPSERHRKKLSYEKLQKAFEEELHRLKEDSRRAAAAKQEAADKESKMRSSGGGSSSAEHYSMRDVNSDPEDDDEYQALLDDGKSSQRRAVEERSRQSVMSTMMSQIADEREVGIKRIQHQVMEVNQIFKDLACIVTEQGAQFETIEQQASDSSANAKQAVKELKKAADRQRSQRERLCCILGVLVIVLTILILPHLHITAHAAIAPAPVVSTHSELIGDRGEGVEGALAGESAIVQQAAGTIKQSDAQASTFLADTSQQEKANWWPTPAGTRVIKRMGQSVH